MRAANLTLLIGVALVAACNDAPTNPVARRVAPQAKPSDALITAVTWTATKLPFVPKGINAAGVVVGTQDIGNGVLAAVRWQNGTTQQLSPAYATYKCYGPNIATAVSPSGFIAGNIGDCLVEWSPNGVLYAIIAFPGLAKYKALAIYDDGTVLGEARFSTGTAAFQYVLTAGQDGISPMGFSPRGVDGLGNVYGTTAGGMPARWSVAHGLSTLTVLAGFTGGYVLSAAAGGNVLGMLHDTGGSDVPVQWSANGSVTTLAGLPSNVSYINSAGRLAGYGWFTGAASQVWTSYQGALTVLTSPDAVMYQPTGVSDCGAIIATAGLFPTTGAIFQPTRFGSPVCDQAPVATTIAGQNTRV